MYGVSTVANYGWTTPLKQVKFIISNLPALIVRCYPIRAIFIGEVQHHPDYQEGAILGDVHFDFGKSWAELVRILLSPVEG